MAQNLTQTQALKQTQSLTPQQLQVVRMLEMPVSELEECIHTELLDNAALVTKDDDLDSDNNMEENGGDDLSMDSDPASVRDSSLDDYSSEDDTPDWLLERSSNQSARQEQEIPFSENNTFYEELDKQIGEHELTEHQQELVKYLIGSLDDDGLLRKDLSSIEDELMIYHNVMVKDGELEQALKVLKSFDPAGIGARNLQECLLIQLKRRKDSRFRTLEIEVINNYFDEFTHKHWERIQQKLGLSDDDFKQVIFDLTHLNPRPGSSLGEITGKNFQQILPDFIVDTDDDGHISISLNNGNIPELHISRSFRDSLEDLTKRKDKMSKSAREGLLYTKQKIDAAQGFINAVKQRQMTLYSTMKAIVNLQRPFFLEGDESLLKPMILKDVADKTGLDISTISRVSNSKYVQTNYGIYPLKFFFSDGYTTQDGEELSTREIRRILKECIDKEDKKRPMTDEALAGILKDKGYPIARRTVAKYREQLGLPVARMRKQG